MLAGKQMRQRAFTAARPTARGPRPAIAPRRHGGAVCVAALSAGNFNEDPYTVLGVPPDSDTNTVNRAYAAKKYAARGNDEESKRVEAAHSKLMMGSLSARMKGISVDKNALYADREPLFPWKPRRWNATPKVIVLVGIMQLVLSVFALQAPNMSKVIGSMLIGIAGNVIKQNAISPPPRDPQMATEEESGRAGKNFVRAALLGLGATFAGVLLFSAPEYLAQALKMQLPEPLMSPAVQVSLKCFGSALSNWVMTSYYY
ncbi:MAG: hypothetical protein J3K34DRAFT_419445 [Monoraphidium minutum]|nr:MAG: hypothetical protein J3K34DRAFT_419445 [Monoraphidium minutum]